jgi:acyl-CoA reductase-like NAD-dependent aldehyde dehydrogenase
MDLKSGQLIRGNWCKGNSADVITAADPATEEVLNQFPAASAHDTENAIAAADVAQTHWRKTSAWTRTDILHKCADVMGARAEEAARHITLEAGKPLAQSRREWQLSVDQFRWYAEEARRITGQIIESRAPGGRLEVHHEPIGVVAALTFKRVTTEWGGNAPVIVFDDANLEATLDICVAVKFANAGQVCVTGDRFYVHESSHDKFVDGFAARATALKLGHGLDDATQMGPLINARHVASHAGQWRCADGAGAVA